MLVSFRIFFLRSTKIMMALLESQHDKFFYLNFLGVNKVMSEIC